MKIFPGDFVRHRAAPVDSPTQTVVTVDGDRATVSWSLDGRNVSRETYAVADMTLVEPIIQFFRYEHLPPHLREVSKSFRWIADVVLATVPRNPERTVALRKLLEAKDAAVRAALFEQ